MVSAALDDSATGADRVDALLLLAMMDYWTEGSPSAAKWCEQALEASGDDRRLLARCHAALADLAPFEAPRLLEHARRAVELLSEEHDPPADLLANALKNVAYHELRLGQGLSLSTLEHAVAIEASCEPLPVLERVGMYIGMLYRFAGEFDEARTWLLAMLQCAHDEGDDSALPTIYGHLALLECWAGNFPLAMTYVASGNEFTILTGVASPSVTAAHAFALSAIGNIDEARQVATAAIADDEAQHDDGDVACDLRSLGFAELAAGNLSAAADHLLRALTIVDDLGVLEPSILRIHADAVEALVGLGRLAEAEGLTAELNDPSMLIQRGRGRWHCAAAACWHWRPATWRGPRQPSPPRSAVTRRSRCRSKKRGTRLWLGVVLRRAGQRRNARTALDGALRAFESLGTPLFAERTRAELARLGGRSADDECAHLDRSASRPTRRRGQDEHRSRRGAVRQRANSGKSPHAHLPQTWRALPHRARPHSTARHGTTFGTRLTHRWRCVGSEIAQHDRGEIDHGSLGCLWIAREVRQRWRCHREASVSSCNEDHVERGVPEGVVAQPVDVLRARLELRIESRIRLAGKGLHGEDHAGISVRRVLADSATSTAGDLHWLLHRGGDVSFAEQLAGRCVSAGPAANI